MRQVITRRYSPIIAEAHNDGGVVSDASDGPGGVAAATRKAEKEPSGKGKGKKRKNKDEESKRGKKPKLLARRYSQRLKFTFNTLS